MPGQFTPDQWKVQGSGCWVRKKWARNPQIEINYQSAGKTNCW